ncbi:hypothetical protein F9L33_01740 [Amylibacter sp. SFDW26]|uniref:hypothetical protein n=1 Tax=Amylibacter sp. SFDW26 TaxID=2652722 RepID=UPI001262842A|nr:hypothetical protein [Amylibacter sp. SFDW26]KAB7615510.1 hypothetical protein F9L33_01740 [Amylibacter sp. SFDW26]
MTVFRVQSQAGEIYNPRYPRRDVMGLLAKKIEQFSSPPRVSIQLPAHHQSSPFALHPPDHNTLVIDFRWLGYAAGLKALPDLSVPYHKAGQEADGLSFLINSLREYAPDCAVDVVAHRFGARVALAAIRKTKSKMWRNLLLSNAFEFSAQALYALDCPMGAHLRIHNLIAQKRRMLPYLFDKLGPKPGPADQAICFGYKFPHSNWVEVPEASEMAEDLMLRMGANIIASRQRRIALFTNLLATK